MPAHQHTYRAHPVKQTGKKAGKRSVSMPPLNDRQQVKGPSHASATSQKEVRKPVRQAAKKLRKY